VGRRLNTEREYSSSRRSGGSKAHVRTDTRHTKKPHFSYSELVKTSKSVKISSYVFQDHDISPYYVYERLNNIEIVSCNWISIIGIP
jgi:hypothetical protein